VSKDRNFDHQFLDLKRDDASDRLFMGGMKLSQRSRLFVLTGLLALAGLAALFLHADRGLDRALGRTAAADKIAELAAVVEKEVADARGEEKKFVIRKNPGTAEAFATHVGQAAKALDRLASIRETESVRKHIITVRDGLAQYDQQFTKLVQSEKSLGLADGSGLARELRSVSEELQAKFSTAGHANLAGQVGRINRDGEETLASGSKKGIEEIEKRYQALATFLKDTKLPEKQKEEFRDLLKRHETALLAMINARFAFNEEAQRFDDIIAYLQPSLKALTRFASHAQVRTADDLKQAHQTARWFVGAGGAVILIVVVVVGMVMLSSVTSSVRVLAAVAGRLADGDRSVAVPGRGNSDAVGTLARALDKWLDNLADLDHLRFELDQTRSRLEKALADQETDAMAAAEAARKALLADVREDDEETAAKAAGRAPAPSGLPGRYGPLPGEATEFPAGGGPISSISRQLASFSQYVTAAANDVDRTEALVRNLEDASRQIDEMGSLVTSIRDQTNLLAFRTGSKDTGLDNLVILSSEDRRPASEKAFPDADMVKRFDTIRDATDRAERTAHAVRTLMADVIKIAREIAATASAQALEATSKLLSQSEYLQSMLDEVISKIRPAQPGELSVEKEAKPRGGKKKEKDETPPRKA
jgi:methyl-accepting chemotaxis protein